MKLCPQCDDSVLIDKHTAYFGGHGIEMFIYSLYQCNICPAIGRSGRYVYCRLCLEIVQTIDQSMHESTKHSSHFLRMNFEPYSSRNFDFSKINAKRNLSTTTIAYMPLSLGTHVSLLNFSNITLPDELIDAVNDFQYASADYSTINEFMKEFALNNTHSCMFCGDDYETFPSKKIVYTHLKMCIFAVEMRETNKQI